jgi:hypothetical protein
MPSDTEVEMPNGCLEALLHKELSQDRQNWMMAQQKLVLRLLVTHN